MDFEEMNRVYRTARTEGTKPNVQWHSNWDVPHPNDAVAYERDFIVVQVDGGYLIARSRDGLGSLVYVTIASSPNYEDAVEIASSLNKTVW